MIERKASLTPLEQDFKQRCLAHILGEEDIKKEILAHSTLRVKTVLSDGKPPSENLLASVNLRHVGVPQVNHGEFTNPYSSSEDFLLRVRFEIRAAAEDLLLGNALEFVRLMSADQSQLNTQFKEISDTRRTRIFSETVIEAFIEVTNFTLAELWPLLAGADHPEAPSN